MDEKVARGRRLLLVISFVFVGISLFSILGYVLQLGFGKLPQQFIRLFLTVGLLYLTYQGKRWTKWAMAAFASLGFGTGIIGAIAALECSFIGALFLGLLALIYGALSVILMASSSIAAFQAYQRESL